MPNFVQIFKERGNISFVGMRDTAISLLPIKELFRIIYDLSSFKAKYIQVYK